MTTLNAGGTKVDGLVKQLVEFCGGPSPELDLLVQFLKDPRVEPRLAKAPASTAHRFHHAHEGGLIDHIMDTLGTAEAVCSGLNGLLTRQAMVPVFNLNPNIPRVRKVDLAMAVVLHDIHKIGDARGVERFQPNFLKSGKVSDAIPWKTSEEVDRLHREVGPATLVVNANTSPAWIQAATLLERNPDAFPDGEWSIALVAALAPALYAALTEDVKFAIRYHDGAYGIGRRELAGKETALQMILHFADMWSSRINTLAYAAKN